MNENEWETTTTLNETIKRLEIENAKLKRKINELKTVIAGLKVYVRGD